MGEGVILNRLPIQFHAFHMDALGRLVGRRNHKVFAVFKMQSGLGEQRCSDDIFG